MSTRKKVSCDGDSFWDSFGFAPGAEERKELKSISTVEATVELKSSLSRVVSAKSGASKAVPATPSITCFDPSSADYFAQQSRYCSVATVPLLPQPPQPQNKINQVGAMIFDAFFCPPPKNQQKQKTISPKQRVSPSFSSSKAASSQTIIADSIRSIIPEASNLFANIISPGRVSEAITSMVAISNSNLPRQPTPYGYKPSSSYSEDSYTFGNRNNSTSCGEDGVLPASSMTTKKSGGSNTTGNNVKIAVAYPQNQQSLLNATLNSTKAVVSHIVAQTVSSATKTNGGRGGGNNDERRKLAEELCRDSKIDGLWESSDVGGLSWKRNKTVWGKSDALFVGFADDNGLVEKRSLLGDRSNLLSENDAISE
ncbi:hypothetical protein HK100_005455 [Physocladia obscura]|uniref:Uncharacterized protein n=1 Tax=Physocladia obscura TaxID=109957 RepID=A0AAD5XKM5_9FUNG|nr:hypothetical protein HK100_005455 [Physocladia obscura]